jgi:polysaccharide biosynthesis protein PelF
MEKSVVLSLEGTYPYHGGGVSTWAHLLCSKIKGYDFKLYSVNALHEKTYKYDLSDSINEVIQVPMWSALEPKELMRYDNSYSSFIEKKEFTKDSEINDYFIPLLDRLLTEIYENETSTENLEDIIICMWHFFQTNDYKETMKNPLVWNSFKEKIINIIGEQELIEVTLFDLTVAMRWIYHFLIPMSIDFPKSSISHLTLSGFSIVPAIIQKHKYGTPIMITEHGVFIRERLLAISQSDSSYFLKDFLIRFSQIMSRLTYAKSDKIVSVNKFNMTWELMYGAKKEKIKVIYNGIDHQRFIPRQKPAELKDIPTVVAMARVFELKDILTMIKSCKVVKEVLPNVQFRIYGENNVVPEYTNKCNSLIAELGLEENFIFLGPHPKPEMVFCEGDISILTSISEGFPYTIIESMSCGIPVVSTDVGGVAEALNADCGILCKPKNHQEIGEAVIKLLQNSELRAEMGIKSRERVESFFTIDKFISQYQDVYDELLGVDKTPIKVQKRSRIFSKTRTILK